MKDLKMGDFVQLFDFDRWSSGVFLKYCQDGIKAVFECNPLQYQKVIWKSTEWRMIPGKKYREFTWEDRELLRGRWIRNKEESRESMIVELNLKEYKKDDQVFLQVYLSDGMGYLADTLLEGYEFVDDGSPVGVLIHE